MNIIIKGICLPEACPNERHIISLQKLNRNNKLWERDVSNLIVIIAEKDEGMLGSMKMIWEI